MAFSESLSPIDRFVSIVIDEVALNPKMTFDRNGMLIGHAINDVTEDFTQEILANKMICYSVQGISSTFSKVSEPNTRISDDHFFKFSKKSDFL